MSISRAASPLAKADWNTLVLGLAAAYNDQWSSGKQDELLASVGYGSKSLDEWLRNGFAEQHNSVFQNRPFIWHIWDGRKEDGFGALVNYHKLDAKLLDRLIYTYLGDWIKRQGASRRARGVRRRRSAVGGAEPREEAQADRRGRAAV